MTAETKKKMENFRIPETISKSFTEITKEKGVSKTAVIKAFMAEYVDQGKNKNSCS